jgi:hypothetical protein
MGGERRGERERDGFSAPAAAFDLDEAALDAAKSIQHAAIEQLTLLCEDRPATGAIKQAHAEILFETSQHPADRRLGHVQFGCRRREAAVARGRIEDEQGIAGRQHPAKFWHNIRL